MALGTGLVLGLPGVITDFVRIRSAPTDGILRFGSLVPRTAIGRFQFASVLALGGFSGRMVDMEIEKI
jgi:hypothetical protein